MSVACGIPIIRPCRASPYPPTTNQEVLHHLRTQLEYNHRHFGTWMQIRKRLTLSAAPTVQDVTLDHLQDCCNKSTAVYQFGSSKSAYMFDATYKQWFQGHQTNVEFGTYLAKIINLNEPATTVGDVIRIHQALCDLVVGLRQKLDCHDGTTILDNGGMFDHGLNWEQRACYQLQQLFRALIVVVDHELWDENDDQTVRLVLTGVSEGLSAPVTFDSIPESDRRPDPQNQGVILASLQTAIRFLMAMERREMDANSDGQNQNVVDQSKIYGIPDIDECAKDLGFTGGAIMGPSTAWVHCPGYGFGPS